LRSKAVERGASREWSEVERGNVAVRAETVGRLVLDKCDVESSSELFSGPKECFETVAVISSLPKDETYFPPSYRSLNQLYSTPRPLPSSTRPLSFTLGASASTSSFSSFSHSPPRCSLSREAMFSSELATLRKLGIRHVSSLLLPPVTLEDPMLIESEEDDVGIESSVEFRNGLVNCSHDVERFECSM